MSADNFSFLAPERQLPDYHSTSSEEAFLHVLERAIRGAGGKAPDAGEVDRRFNATSFPQRFDRLILILYAAGHKRVVVSRMGQRSEYRF